MASYLTVQHGGKAVYEDRKSVFIGRCSRAETESEALSFLESVRREYPDAKHHVYAYILRENATTRFSDDHEPQGTAGMPVLDAMRKQGLVDCVTVVVRYFGGTLLGTGGLVRAYTEAAVGAIADAGIVRYDHYLSIRVFLSYADYQRFSAVAEEFDYLVEASDFGSSVTLVGSLPKERSDAFLKALADFSAGRANYEILEEKFDFRK